MTRTLVCPLVAVCKGARSRGNYISHYSQKPKLLFCNSICGLKEAYGPLKVGLLCPLIFFVELLRPGQALGLPTLSWRIPGDLELKPQKIAQP